MKTITLTIPTITLPTDVWKATLTSSITKAQTALKNATLFLTDFAERNTQTVSSDIKRKNPVGNIKNMFQKFSGNNKKFIKFVPLFIVAIVVVFAVGTFLRNNNQTVLGSNDSDVLKIDDSTAEVALNKSLSFPVMDDQGEEVGRVEYTLEKAELRDQLIIKGQQARAIEGRDFLIIHIKLRNDTNSAISVNTRDFIRLKMKGTDEQFAPTIHNDPVEVQAISSLTTRLGFSISEEDEDLTVLFGEIKGDKETVKLSF